MITPQSMRMLGYYTGGRKGKAADTHLARGRTALVVKGEEDTALASLAAREEKHHARDPCETQASTVWMPCNGRCGMSGTGWWEMLALQLGAGGGYPEEYRKIKLIKLVLTQQGSAVVS